MTNISVRQSGPFTAEDRSWLWGPHGTEPGTTPSATLKVASFPAGDGYVPSGTAVSKDADGKWIPFNAAAPSGEHGLTFASVRNDQGDVGTAVLVHGFVKYSALPATGRPTIAALRTALPLIHFSA